MGNLGSIVNMFKKIGANNIVTSDSQTIRDAEKIILPGVSAFDKAIKRIDELGLREVLFKIAKEKKKPMLGICLGMQLFM